MKYTSGTYWFFYIAFFVVICIAIFLEKKFLIYTKSITSVALIVLYHRFVKSPSILFPASMIMIIITDVLTYMDFLKYFEVIAVLITMFYIICVLLLKKYISKEDLKPEKILSIPILIGAVLIFYLIYSIAQLTVPRVNNSIEFVMLIVISMLMFSAVSFAIYVVDRYEKTIYLFIAACCTLFVDALLAVNELYFYSRVFTVLINIAEILGIYFFTSFFIETKPKDLTLKEDSFF